MEQIPDELDINGIIFDEVNAQKDRDESLSEKRQQELMKQQVFIQSEEHKILADERTERKKNGKLALEEMRRDISQQQQLGRFNLSIQQASTDRRNRKHVNSIISEIKVFSLDLDRCYMRAYEHWK